MTSFCYDVTGDIIYIWALTLTPAKLGILNNQWERNGTPLIMPIHVEERKYMERMRITQIFDNFP